MMKKWKRLLQLVMIVGLAVLVVPGCSANSNPVDSHLSGPVPVLIKMDDGEMKSGITALIDGNEVLIPVDGIMKYMNTNVSFETVEKRVYLYMGQVPFKLENPELDERLEDGITLNFTPREIKGVFYLNIKGLEKVLGIKMTPGTGNTILIEKENYWGKSLNHPRNKWSSKGKINLVWDYVNLTSPNLDKEAKIEGLNVISPTWFSIVTNEGFVLSKADAKYVADAHRKGYKVWALVNNSFDCDMTHQVLADEKAQEKVIKQLIVYSSLYNLDGMNIDFENVYDEDKERLSQFVEKISKALHQQNIVVSVDVTVPSNSPFWSNCYDRKKLGAAVDYVMVMTYDEHWSRSPKSGPVASLGWVEAGVKKMLLEVPKEKLLLGVPFYTREWEESENGRVKSKSMSMAAVEDLIKEKNLDVVWLEDKGLHYTEYYKEGSRYRIWIEDEKSIGLKLGLIDKYNLVGVAGWRKGFERNSIWNVINTGLKITPTSSMNKPIQS